MVLLHQATGGGPDLPGLSAEEVPVARRAANFDLSVEFVERDGGLAGALEYNTDLFDATTVERLGGHPLGPLDGVAADPHRPPGDLPVLAGTERRPLFP